MVMKWSTSAAGAMCAYAMLDNDRCHQYHYFSEGALHGTHQHLLTLLCNMLRRIHSTRVATLSPMLESTHPLLVL